MLVSAPPRTRECCKTDDSRCMQPPTHLRIARKVVLVKLEHRQVLQHMMLHSRHVLIAHPVLGSRACEALRVVCVCMCVYMHVCGMCVREHACVGMHVRVRAHAFMCAHSANT